MTKALMVVTNNPKFKKIQRATGIWLKEASHFNKVMADNGIDVDYVSPQGGYVPIDPLSLGTDDMDATDWEYYLDDTFRNEHLAKSLKPADVDPQDYQVIYFVGGHGSMTDFTENTELAAIAEKKSMPMTGSLPLIASASAAYCQCGRLTETGLSTVAS